MKPIEAKTHDDICELPRDNIETSSGMDLLLHEDHVSVHLPDGTWAEIPRKDFEEMIAWYQHGIAPAESRED